MVTVYGQLDDDIQSKLELMCVSNIMRRWDDLVGFLKSYNAILLVDAIMVA